MGAEVVVAPGLFYIDCSSSPCLSVSDWGIHLLRHLQVLAASFPDCFPPNHVAGEAIVDGLN